MKVEDIWRKDTSCPRSTRRAVIAQVSSGGSGVKHIRSVISVYPTSVGLYKRPLGATRVCEPMLGVYDKDKYSADNQDACDR